MVSLSRYRGPTEIKFEPGWLKYGSIQKISRHKAQVDSPPCKKENERKKSIIAADNLDPRRYVTASYKTFNLRHTLRLGGPLRIMLPEVVDIKAYRESFYSQFATTSPVL